MEVYPTTASGVKFSRTVFFRGFICYQRWELRSARLDGGCNNNSLTSIPHTCRASAMGRESERISNGSVPFTASAVPGHESVRKNL